MSKLFFTITLTLLLIFTISSIFPQNLKEVDSYFKNKITNKNIDYISPFPGSKLNSISTNIIIKSKNLLNHESLFKPNLITVKGSKSGLHTGNLRISDDGKTLLFLPEFPFQNDEYVSIKLNNGLYDNLGNQVGGEDFTFLTSNNNPQDFKEIASSFLLKEFEENNNSRNPVSKSAYKMNSPSGVNRKVNGFPIDFPSITILNSSNPTDGQIFLDDEPYLNNAYPSFLMILNNDGSPFYYKKTLYNGITDFTFDFKMQSNGNFTYCDQLQGVFYEMDSTFSIIDSFHCGNGYPIDVHDIELLPNGHCLLFGDDFEIVDMSQVVTGGKTNALLMGIVVQELDQNKNVVFQWRTFDHFQITDAASDINLTGAVIDYVHTNAIFMDNDGNIVISSRHLDEITKINGQTGDIIWRWGGKNNQFTFINDPIPFSHQHCIRRIANSDFTLFDNGNLHQNTLAGSRAMEFQVDEVNKIATQVWQFQNNNPAEYSWFMGSVQRLDDRNTFIGWGGANPSVTEVTPAGQKVYEMTLPNGVFSYRAFRTQLSKGYYLPFVPSLVSPGNGSTLQGYSTMLNWTKNKFAQSFHLQVATDAAFTNNIIDSTLIPNSITSFSLSSLQANNTYYWHVMSDNNTDTVGGYSGYSDTWSFSPPIAQTPIPSWPIGGAIVYTLNQLLSWYLNNANGGIYTFDVQYSTDSTFNTGVTNITGLSSNSTTVSLLGAKKYFWRVRSKNSGGLYSIYSNIASFVTDSSLGGAPLPVPSWPVGGATIYSNSPTLTWYLNELAIGTMSYDVVVTDLTLSVQVNSVSTSNNFIRLNNLTAGHTYLWKVQTHNGSNLSGYASATFIIDASITAATVPIASWPVGGADVFSSKPALSWYLPGVVSGSPTFDIELTTVSGNYLHPSFSYLAQPGYSFTIPDALTPGQTYFWHIRTNNNSLQSAYSIEARFKVDSSQTAIPTPVPSWPVGGNTVYNNPPTFNWYLNSGAPTGSYYDLEIKEADIPFDGLDLFTPISANSYTILSALNSGTAYHWRVKLHSGAAQSSWSDENINGGALFTTVAADGSTAVPRLGGPIDNTDILTTSASFSWYLTTAPSQDQLYSIQVANDDTMNNVVYKKDNLTGLTAKINLPSAGKYYWLINVTTKDNQHHGTSATGSFTVNTITSVNGENNSVPKTFEVFQNYPNPFNPSTTIRLALPKASHVSVKVYNMLGQEIKALINGNKTMGNYSVVWNGDDNSGKKVAGGVYIYRVITGSNNVSKKMILLK